MDGSGWPSDLQDGQPFQLNYNFEGDYSGSGEGFDRPDVVGPIRYGSGAFKRGPIVVPGALHVRNTTASRARR